MTGNADEDHSGAPARGTSARPGISGWHAEILCCSLPFACMPIAAMPRRLAALSKVAPRVRGGGGALAAWNGGSAAIARAPRA